MNDPLFVHAAMALVMGCALLLVWRRDPSQAYARYFGWATIVHAILSVTEMWRFREGLVALPGAYLAWSLVEAVYTTLLLMGVACLAQRPLASKVVWGVLALLAMTHLATILLGGIPFGQAGMALIETLLGLICTYWLWSPQHRRHVAEWLIGPLLILLGLSPFIGAVHPDGGGALPSMAGMVLRHALGLVVLYVAMDLGLQRIRKMQRRYERLTEHSHQGIMVTIGQGKIVYANRACLATYGVDSLQALGLATVARTIAKAERLKIGRILNDISKGQESDARFESLRHRSDGTPIWLRFHYFATEWDGRPAVQVLISDETDQHRANEALIYQAMHDELTGLPNRAAMIQSLRARCDATGDKARFVLILMNIDRFKLFNEAHGPSMGDDVLKAMGDALRATLSDGCEVMRLAGDEFAFLSAHDSGGETAVEMVTAVRNLLVKPLLVTDHEFFLDVSLGIALFPNSARDAESLLRAANAAMHVAKRTPGTSHRLAEKAFERGSSNALEQEQALRLGIERGEFELVYQPKVNAQTGLLTSLEALARWNRAGIGQVSPLDFIGAAERTGLIGVLGTNLLKQACHQISSWLATYGQCLPVAVNVSPLQMLDPRFPNLVSQILKDSDVEPHWLTLEITESSAVQNLEQTKVQIEQLRTMGVHVAMDDFGTGFSSLNMLRELRLHTVKIDRGLIDPLPSPDAVAVVRAICQLADALHLHVVAEGIETADQAHAARDAGCGELQGYLYSRPLTAQDVGAWLGRLSSGYANIDIEVPTLSVKLRE